MKIIDYGDKSFSEIPWQEISFEKDFVLIYKGERDYFYVSEMSLKKVTSSFSLETFPNPTLGIFSDLDNAKLFAKAYSNDKFQSDVFCTKESQKQDLKIAINNQKVDLPDGIYDAKWIGHYIEIILPKKESDSFDNSVWASTFIGCRKVGFEIKVEIISGMLYVVK